MDKEIRDRIEQVFIDAILKAQSEVESKFKVKTQIDFDWEAIEPNIVSDDVYLAM